jgi:hypothetical protein
MAEITYASIEPLLKHAEESSGSIRCTFACPITAGELDATGPLEKGVGLGDVSSSDDSLLGSLRSTLGGLFSSILGGPPPLEVTRAAGAKHEAYTDSERKAGIVLAFHTVATQFVWDPQTERWISAEGAGELLTEFDRLLKVSPIQQDLDRKITARMLVEVARADGQVTQTEWGFLSCFIPGDLSSIDTYMDAPALTPQELDATCKGAARDTMLMLAWALAHVDHNLDDQEVEQLLGYARGLKIPASRARELQSHAQHFLLEEAFQRAFPKGKLKSSRRKDALALGAQMGMSAAEVRSFEQRFKRRWGI